MNGVEEYDKKIMDRILNRIVRQPQTYLLGFFNWLDGSYKTKETYINHIIFFLDNIKKEIKHVTIDDISNYMSSIDNKSYSYKNGVYSALKRLYEYLYINRLVDDNLMLYVMKPKYKETKTTYMNRENGFLSKEEVLIVLDNIRSGGTGSDYAIKIRDPWKKRDEMIFILFLVTGMRCSEMYKLDVDDIDLYNKKLFIAIKGGKIRQCILSDEVIGYITEWLKDREQKLNGIKNKTNAFIISKKRVRLSQKGIASVIKTYTNVINDKNISPHKIRATFISQLYEATNDIYFVQNEVGHASPKTTERYVRGINNTDKAANIMMDLVNNNG